jgi:hypothetical protein
VHLDWNYKVDVQTVFQYKAARLRISAAHRSQDFSLDVMNAIWNSCPQVAHSSPQAQRFLGKFTACCLLCSFVRAFSLSTEVTPNVPIHRKKETKLMSSRLQCSTNQAFTLVFSSQSGPLSKFFALPPKSISTSFSSRYQRKWKFRDEDKEMALTKKKSTDPFSSMLYGRIPAGQRSVHEWVIRHFKIQATERKPAMNSPKSALASPDI